VTLHFQLLAPAPDLRPFIRHYWTLTGHTASSAMHPVFPDGCAEIVLNLGPLAHEILPSGRPVVQPAALFVGQMTRPVHLSPGPSLRMIGVKLTPWGAAALLGDESVRVRDVTAALDDLGPNQFRHLAERLERCAGDHEIAPTLDAAFRERAAAARPATLHAVRQLAAVLDSVPPGSLGEWGRRLECSARTLERRFDRFVGISPKEFVRIRRFQLALRLSSATPAPTWATVAARAGYCDQAHLARDFRQFAGASPSVAEASSTDLSAVFVAGAS
jgi:AraC-like DNA-binding protein